MKVVVAGASGLIGTALRAGLRADGHTVVRLVRRATARRCHGSNVRSKTAPTD